MAAFNLTADDSSPLIIYSAGGWTDTPDDPLLNQFTGGSFHTTTTAGATASFTFVGTGVYLFGSHRPNYGAFTVSVDGKTIKGTANAQTPTIAPLASFPNLPMGSHTVKLTNDGSGMDLDQIVVQTEVGNAGDALEVAAFDDTDPTISYLPSPEVWKINEGNEFLNGTLHFTQSPNAGFSLKFSGEAVAIFGATSSDHANFTVSIDNGKPQSIFAQAPKLHTETLTFFAAGLSPGSHSLELKSQLPSDGGQQGFIDLDQVTVFGTSKSGTAGTVNQPNVDATKPLSSNKSLLIGLIVGSVLVFLILLALCFMLWRIRRRRREAAGKRSLVLPTKLTFGSSLISSRLGGKSKRDSHNLPLQPPPAHLSPESELPPPRPSFESYMTERSTAPLRGGLFPSVPSRDIGRGSIYATSQPSPRRGNPVYNDPSERV